MSDSSRTLRRKARERMRARRKQTDYAYDRARNRAVARLISLHRKEFGRLLEAEKTQA